MECSKIQEKLSAYLENLFTPEEKMLINEHLKSCQKCRESLADLRKTIEHVKNLEEVEPPSWLTQKVMAKIKEEAKEKRNIFEKLFYPLHVKIPIQAAATILIAIATIYVFKAIESDVKLTETPSETIPSYTMQREKQQVQTESKRAEKPVAPSKQAEPELMLLKKAEKKDTPLKEVDKIALLGKTTPAPAKPAEQPPTVKEPEETLQYEKGSKTLEPMKKMDEAMPSAGAVVKEESKREGAPTELKAKVLAEKKREDISWIKYKNNKLQTEFSYPSDYEISSEEYGSSECKFSLILKQKQYIDSSTKDSGYAFYSILKVTFVESSFDEAAEDNYFKKKDDKWVVLGRHGMTTEATYIRDKNWRGLKGETFVGIHDEKGYAGLQEILKIFAMFENTAGCSVVFYSENIPEEIFYQILSSFKFLK